ncbi:hypothetical protein BDN72DRAFT_895306 [Pluteus cervinus]|uniref:Uncharacterized protein n=1 Tax=Pluteus cervinus TaxID=181527 RepID=A0ACD3B4M9_9AGAR|nr:hypothetical protein BDN72DRAFT_895306 [Pluteus cervinus]
MVKVPQIIEGIRKVKDHSLFWRRVAVNVENFQPDIKDLEIYSHITEIAAFSTHTNALFMATRSNDPRNLFAKYEFILKIIPSIPFLPYTFPSPPTNQDTAHYLKIILANLRGEGGKGETTLPVNYIGTSTLQCGFCRAIFRVLEESILPPTDGVKWRFETQGVGHKFPRNWGWPKELVSVVQEILIHQSSKGSLPQCSDSKSPPASQSDDKVGWAVRVPPCSIADPDSATEVEDTMMRLFTLTLSQVLCLGWKRWEDDMMDGMLCSDLMKAEFNLLQKKYIGVVDGRTSRNSSTCD